MLAPKPSLRFGRARRLIDPSDFEVVRNEGNSYRGSTLILGVKPDAAERRFRVGIITSRRVGGAVVRNRVRRRLREIVRKHQHSIASGFLIVLVARPAAAGAAASALEDEWLRLAKRASILAA